MMRFVEVARRQKSSPQVVVNRMGATDGQSVSLAEFRDYLSVTETLSMPDLSSQIALALRKGKSPVTVHGRNDLRTALWPLVDTIAPGRVSALTLARHLRRFIRDDSGASALEFALIAIPAVFFTFGLIEFAPAGRS